MYEAWGHQSPLSRRPDPPHIVEGWVSPQTTGPALCGLELAPRKLEHLGVAAQLRIDVCRACQRALDDRRPSSPLIDLNARRRAKANGRPR